MKILYFMCGISGSGKDFYIYNRFLEDFPEVQDILDNYKIKLTDLIVCPDDLRRELLGSVNEQSRDKYIFDESKNRINGKLEEYGVVVFNATNVSKYGLKYVYSIESDSKVMLVFRPDVALSWERIKNQINNGEDRNAVPFDVIEKQYNNFKLRVVGDDKWDGEWNDEVKEKIVNRHNLPFRNQKFHFID